MVCWNLGAGGVRVAIDGLAALAAEQLIDRHAGLAALDVPQRLVDAADGVVQHRAVAPVGAVVAGLPDVVDAVGGLADQERLQILLDRGIDQVGALREGGAAVAVQAVLVGGDLDDGEPQAGGRGGDHADVLDDRRGEAASGLGGLRLGVLRPGREQSGRSGGHALQQISSVHLAGAHFRSL